MKLPGRAPFAGQVVWLTPEQGGRAAGPPAPSDHLDYAATAFVPPATIDTGLASFVLTGFEQAAWTSPARGSWLVVDNRDNQLVQAGSMVVVTEGRRIVAYFHVEQVDTPGA